MADVKITQENKWAHWLRRAYSHAHCSSDPSTQLGAVLLGKIEDQELAYAWNSFPGGVRSRQPDSRNLDLERWTRPLKYQFIEHAERNAIYMAAKMGNKTDGGTMVCPWAACADCARGIIQAGIKKLVVHKQMHEASEGHWGDSIAFGHTMLAEANVEIIAFDGKINTAPILLNGQAFDPNASD